VKLAIVRQRFETSGGIERLVARSLPVLERGGAQVTLITRAAQGWGARRVLRVDPFHIGRLWGEHSFARAARNAWLREGFDLVQSHEPIPGCHVYWPGEGLQRQARVQHTIEHPRLRAVICGSRRMRDEIRRAFRIAPEKLHVIYGGVDLARFHPDERERLRGAARAELGCRPRDTVFLATGEGLDVAIAALAAAANEAYWLVVAGNNPGTKAKGVHFVGQREDLRPLYAAADCLVLPGREGSFASAVLEALAMGLPAIVSARSGAAEAIEAGVNGWLCDADDARGLARLLRGADEALRAASMAAAVRSSAERFDIDAMARELAALYARL
jgi:UDP-glucose:(heptosyl)LPS alpha-1,3-glucosyltransferase